MYVHFKKVILPSPLLSTSLLSILWSLSWSQFSPTQAAGDLLSRLKTEQPDKQLFLMATACEVIQHYFQYLSFNIYFLILFSNIYFNIYFPHGHCLWGHSSYSFSKFIFQYLFFIIHFPIFVFHYLFSNICFPLSIFQYYFLSWPLLVRWFFIFLQQQPLHCHDNKMWPHSW